MTPDSTIVIGGAIVTLLGAWGYAIKKMSDKGVVCKCKIGICKNSCLECSCDSNDVNDPDFFQEQKAPTADPRSPRPSAII